MIDGFERFLFRLERMRWMQFGYVFESLRDVITAYFALESRANGLEMHELSRAALSKVAASIVFIWTVATNIKDATEMPTFLLSISSTISAIANGSKPIAGLLTFGGP